MTTKARTMATQPALTDFCSVPPAWRSLTSSRGRGIQARRQHRRERVPVGVHGPTVARFGGPEDLSQSGPMLPNMLRTVG